MILCQPWNHCYSLTAIYIYLQYLKPCIELTVTNWKTPTFTELVRTGNISNTQSPNLLMSFKKITSFKLYQLKGPLSCLNQKKSNCNDLLKSSAANPVMILTFLSIRCDVANRWLRHCTVLPPAGNHFFGVFYEGYTMWLCHMESLLNVLLEQERFLKKGKTVLLSTGQISFFLEWVKTKLNVTGK